MKTGRLLLLISSVLLAGCASLYQRTATRAAMISVAQLAPRTESGEMFAGCYGYYAAHGRWPKSTEEIEEGLNVAQREPRYLRGVKGLTLTAEESDLVLSYTSYDDAKMKIRFGRPATQKPNRSVKPMPGPVAPRTPE